MDNRFTVIKDLVMQACERLRKDGISVDSVSVEKIVMDLYESDSKDLERDVLEIERSKRVQHEMSEMMSSELTVAHNLQNLPLQYIGITLNIQDIDLMAIACSNDFNELESALGNITNISGFQPLPGESFEVYRQRVFDGYLASLSPSVEQIRNSNLQLARKLDYLSNSGRVSPQEMEEIYRIIGEKTSGQGVNAIFEALDKFFGNEKVRDMLLTMRDYDPIEKEGIKSSSIEAWRELDRVVRKRYNSITIDEEGKYGRVMLHDGTFNGKHLRKSLDYVRSMGKTARINALMFYMDCPEYIYEMEGPAARSIARERLFSYVDQTTKVLAEYPDVVRSVDVFNELLNRHPMSGDIHYMLRGDIPQERDENGEVYDNIKAGWMKHLTVEDICDVLAVARENLPNVDFMYNDDHLVDLDKLPDTIALIERIQDYSRQLGVKLIDSIGTQMHIDNNISKNQIRHMFLELSKLGLPIEITEFDLAMTSEMEGLTSEQIEIIRQKKINEVYEVIEELGEQCNIRGFTIWSKTDSQNFRVKLANEIRIPQGLEPISTLHGGCFTEEMKDKSYQFMKNLRKQNFNYHGHTSRCGHAGSATEREYIEAARRENIMHIGFSDHVALSPLEHWQQGQRMHISEVDGYISTIRQLQKENPDMVIRCGYEAEYDPLKVGHLCGLRRDVDYMILGQHYVQKGMGLVKSKGNLNYPLVYAQTVCDAMRTGIFDIVAHPDFFMLERDKYSEEDRVLFMENARKASYMICEVAKEMGIPLELNVRGAEDRVRKSDGEFAYPHSLFWEIAAEVGNDVMYGVDSHDPSHLLEIDESRDYVETMIDTSKLNFVEDSYDPVLARENNPTLQEAYEDTKTNAVTQETAMIQMLLSGVEIEEGQDVKDVLDRSMGAYIYKFSADASASIEKVDAKLAKALKDEKLLQEERDALTAKAELRKSRIRETERLREEAIVRAKESISEAHTIGCDTKEEYVEVVGLLTESKTSDDPASLANVNNELDCFRANKSHENTVLATVEETSKTYVYKPSTDNDSGSSDNNSGGFASSWNLLLVVGMLVMFAIILCFMIK